MTLSLTPALKRFVDQKVKNGTYASSDEVVRDALRLLEEKDRVVPGISSLEGIDVETAVQLVLQQAARDAEEDLKEILREMQAILAAKRKLRELIQKVKHDIANNADSLRVTYDSRGMGSERAYHRAPIPVPDSGARDGVRIVTTDLFEGRIAGVAALESVCNELRDKRDSLNEMSEMTSLRLQIALDRRAKAMEALSNILKKISCTQSAIVQNIK